MAPLKDKVTIAQEETIPNTSFAGPYIYFA